MSVLTKISVSIVDRYYHNGIDEDGIVDRLLIFTCKLRDKIMVGTTPLLSPLSLRIRVPVHNDEASEHVAFSVFKGSTIKTGVIRGYLFYIPNYFDNLTGKYGSPFEITMHVTQNTFDEILQFRDVLTFFQLGVVADDLHVIDDSSHEFPIISFSYGIDLAFELK